MSACLHRWQAAHRPWNLSARLIRRQGDIRPPSGDDPELDPPTACMPDSLPDCLPACLPVRPVTGWPYAEPACGFTPKAIHSLPWAGLEPSGDPFPDPPSLPAPPFLRIIEPFPAVPPLGNANPRKTQGYKALDHFGLASNGGLTARAQGCSRRASRRPLTPYGVLTGCPVSARGLLFGGAETGR